MNNIKTKKETIVEKENIPGLCTHGSCTVSLVGYGQ